MKLVAALAHGCARVAAAAEGESDRDQREGGAGPQTHRSPMLSHPMTRFRRALLIASLLAATTGGLAACGRGGDLRRVGRARAAAIFNERCSGCHTLSVAGTQGSTTNVRTREYKDGPNFDQRQVR